MKTNEYQLISQVKSPYSASHSRPVLPVHSQSESQILNFKTDNIDLIDTKRKLSDTPTPQNIIHLLEARHVHYLLELNQNICSLNSDRLSSMLLSNCQSPINNITHTSSAVEACVKCSTPFSLNGSSILIDQRKSVDL